jgi:hypothetical protein
VYVTPEAPSPAVRSLSPNSRSRAKAELVPDAPAPSFSAGVPDTAPKAVDCSCASTSSRSRVWICPSASLRTCCKAAYDGTGGPLLSVPLEGPTLPTERHARGVLVLAPGTLHREASQRAGPGTDRTSAASLVWWRGRIKHRPTGAASGAWSAICSGNQMCAGVQKLLWRWFALQAQPSCVIFARTDTLDRGPQVPLSVARM